VKSWVVKWCLPPGIKAFLWGLKRYFRPQQTVAAAVGHTIGGDVGHADDWKLFREAVVGCKSYAEYGVGNSTLYVDEQQSCRVKSAETDVMWVKKISSATSDNVQVVHIDLGDVGSWGRPTSYERASEFTEYFEVPFSDGFAPDVVLVDGRFRVACFLTALLSASPGTIIIFDDYVTRPQYHVVEKIVQPAETHGRQARFVRPTLIETSKAQSLLTKFMYVMD
jgi:hypothetical protein